MTFNARAVEEHKESSENSKSFVYRLRAPTGQDRDTYFAGLGAEEVDDVELESEDVAEEGSVASSGHSPLSGGDAVAVSASNILGDEDGALSAGTPSPTLSLQNQSDGEGDDGENGVSDSDVAGSVEEGEEEGEEEEHASSSLAAPLPPPPPPLSERQGNGTAVDSISDSIHVTASGAPTAPSQRLVSSPLEPRVSREVYSTHEVSLGGLQGPPTVGNTGPEGTSRSQSPTRRLPPPPPPLPSHVRARLATSQEEQDTSSHKESDAAALGHWKEQPRGTGGPNEVSLEDYYAIVEDALPQSVKQSAEGVLQGRLRQKAIDPSASAIDVEAGGVDLEALDTTLDLLAGDLSEVGGRMERASGEKKEEVSSASAARSDWSSIAPQKLHSELRKRYGNPEERTSGAMTAVEASSPQLWLDLGRALRLMRSAALWKDGEKMAAAVDMAKELLALPVKAPADQGGDSHAPVPLGELPFLHDIVEEVQSMKRLVGVGAALNSLSKVAPPRRASMPGRQEIEGASHTTHSLGSLADAPLSMMLQAPDASYESLPLVQSKFTDEQGLFQPWVASSLDEFGNEVVEDGWEERLLEQAHEGFFPLLEQLQHGATAMHEALPHGVAAEVVQALEYARKQLADLEGLEEPVAIPDYTTLALRRIEVVQRVMAAEEDADYAGVAAALMHPAGGGDTGVFRESTGTLDVVWDWAMVGLDGEIPTEAVCFGSLNTDWGLEYLQNAWRRVLAVCAVRGLEDAVCSGNPMLPGAAATPPRELPHGVEDLDSSLFAAVSIPAAAAERGNPRQFSLPRRPSALMSSNSSRLQQGPPAAFAIDTSHPMFPLLARLTTPSKSLRGVVPDPEYGASLLKSNFFLRALRLNASKGDWKAVDDLLSRAAQEGDMVSEAAEEADAYRSELACRVVLYSLQAACCEGDETAAATGSEDRERALERAIHRSEAMAVKRSDVEVKWLCLLRSFSCAPKFI